MKLKVIDIDEYIDILSESTVLHKQEVLSFIIHNLIYQGKKITLINTPSACLITR